MEAIPKNEPVVPPIDDAREAKEPERKSIRAACSSDVASSIAIFILLACSVVAAIDADMLSSVDVSAFPVSKLVVRVLLSIVDTVWFCLGANFNDSNAFFRASSASISR